MLSQTQTFVCSNCHRVFQAEIWLIINSGKQPDLMHRALNQTIHDAVCKHCGHLNQVSDAPLLIFQPDREPHLIFCPAQEAGWEGKPGRSLAALLEHLKARLGSGWNPAWVDEMVETRLPLLSSFVAPVSEEGDLEEVEDWDFFAETGVGELMEDESLLMAAIESLPDDLRALVDEIADRTETPEEFQRAMAEQHHLVTKIMAAMASQAGDEAVGRQLELVITLLEFIEAGSWPASQRILEAHPELLSKDADAALASMIKILRDRGEASGAEAFEEHRRVLRLCREVGVEAAFEQTIKREAEEIELLERMDDEALALVKAVDSLPSEQRDLMLEILTTSRDSYELEERLGQHPELQFAFAQALARETGDEMVLEEIRLGGILEEFLATESWESARRVVEAHPELLSDDMDRLLTRLINAAKEMRDPEMLAMYVEHRSVLRRSRKVGVKRAFAEIMG